MRTDELADEAIEEWDREVSVGSNTVRANGSANSPTDLTEAGPSLGWVAGQLISTLGELTAFPRTGRMLNHAQLDAMCAMVAVKHAAGA